MFKRGLSAKFDGQPGSEFSGQSLMVFFAPPQSIPEIDFTQMIRTAAEELRLRVTFGTELIAGNGGYYPPTMEWLVADLREQFVIQRDQLARIHKC